MFGWLKRTFGNVKHLDVDDAAGKGNRHRWTVRCDGRFICQSGVRGFDNKTLSEKDFDDFVESIKAGAYTKLFKD